MHLFLVFGVSYNSQGLPEPPHILVNGSFAVCLFLILSGYVISMTSDKIATLEDLTCSIVKRYLRIALPISCIVFIAYVMYLLNLYKIQDIAIATNNSLASFYYKEVSLRSFIENLLFSPIGMHAVLAPCWMLGYIFVGSILVYILNIITRNTPFYLKIFLLLMVMYALYLYSNFLWSCIIFGMITEAVDKKHPNVLGSKVLSIFTVFVVVLGVYIQSRLPELLNTDYKVNGLSAILVWVGVNYCLPLRYLFSLRPFVWFGNISFSVFLVHWPLICSVSCSLYFLLLPLGYVNMLIINLAVSILLMLIVAIAYNRYTEKKSYNLVNTIMNYDKS